MLQENDEEEKREEISVNDIIIRGVESESGDCMNINTEVSENHFSLVRNDLHIQEIKEMRTHNLSELNIKHSFIIHHTNNHDVSID